MNATPASPARPAGPQGVPADVIDLPDRLPGLLAGQKAAFADDRFPDYESRRARLETLYRLVDDNAESLVTALTADFGCRPAEESRLVEINGSLSSVRYLIRRLRRLMHSSRRSTSIWYWPARNRVRYLPLGVVGVVSPWNYPVHLTIAPIAAALAAGNRVMAKVSEHTPRTARTLEDLVGRYYEPDVLRIVTGGVATAQAFVGLPFDHLLATTSTEIGRQIALRAAENLTPVTLELSGKCPAIVTGSFDPEEAASRILWGKVFNAGQTCVAPDYVLVPRDRLIEFVRATRACTARFFREGYTSTSIVNERHHARLQSLLDDARASGAEVLTLTDVQLPARTLAPTLVIDPGPGTRCYEEEVFGPILSVFTYETLDDAIDLIDAHESPLALYVFSHARDEIDFIARSVRVGGISVNDTLAHYLQNDLPFGGVGSSGHGRYHGEEGFRTFSCTQAVFHQRGIGRFTGLKLLYPPYGRLANLMIRLIGLRP